MDATNKREDATCDKNVTCDTRVLSRSNRLWPTALKPYRTWPMRIPQELVDAVIDCAGADCAVFFVAGRLFQPAIGEDGRAELESLALVSRACNHRARSHLFARCNIIGSDYGAFERFGQCPDAILRYTRVLTIRYGENPTTILATLRRFISSPLVSIRLYSTRIPEDLPELLKSLFPTVHRVTVVASTLSAAAALNLVRILECMGELRFQRCHFTALEGNVNLPTLPTLRGRLILSESYPPHSTMTSLLSRTPLPLRSLCFEPFGLPSENKLIDACAGSLEDLEVRVVASLGKPFVSSSDPSLTISIHCKLRFYHRPRFLYQSATHYPLCRLRLWRRCYYIPFRAFVDPPGAQTLEYTAGRG